MSGMKHPAATHFASIPVKLRGHGKRPARGFYEGPTFSVFSQLGPLISLDSISLGNFEKLSTALRSKRWPSHPRAWRHVRGGGCGQGLGALRPASSSGRWRGFNDLAVQVDWRPETDLISMQSWVNYGPIMSHTMLNPIGGLRKAWGKPMKTHENFARDK